MTNRPIPDNVHYLQLPQKRRDLKRKKAELLQDLPEGEMIRAGPFRVELADTSVYLTIPGDPRAVENQLGYIAIANFAASLAKQNIPHQTMTVRVEKFGRRVDMIDTIKLPVEQAKAINEILNLMI